jgi:hypothetical protein
VNKTSFRDPVIRKVVSAGSISLFRLIPPWCVPCLPPVTSPLLHALIAPVHCSGSFCPRTFASFFLSFFRWHFHRSFTSLFLQSGSGVALHNLVTGQIISVRSVSVPVDSSLVRSLPPTCYVSTAPRSHRSSTLFPVLLPTHFRFVLSVVLSVALPPLFHLALFAIRQRSGPS